MNQIRRVFLFRLAVACTGLPLTVLLGQAEEGGTAVPAATEAPAVPADMGFIRFVNAVGLAERVKLKVDGIEPNPAGYGQGEMTGTVGLSPKTYQLELEHPLLGKRTLPMDVQTGQITTIIAFKTDKPDKDAKKKVPGSPPEKKGPRLACYLDTSPVGQSGAAAPELSVVQVTASASLALKVASTAVAVPTEKKVVVPITKGMGNFPEIHHEAKAVCLLNFTEPADKLVVFFTGDDGSLKSVQGSNNIR